MPWLGITAIALAGWYLFFHTKTGHWITAVPSSDGEVGEYQAGNDQIWFVIRTTISTTLRPTEIEWSATRPGTGGQIIAQSLDELTSRIDSF
jgi:hypothetical protein